MIFIKNRRNDKSSFLLNPAPQPQSNDKNMVMPHLKHAFLLFALISQAMTLSAQYDDPIFPKPQSGYGADGSYPVEVTTFPSPDFPGEIIEIFHPDGVTGAVPTLFFSHGFGGTFSNYVRGMLEFIAKKGYAAVFVPYPTTGASIVERLYLPRKLSRKSGRARQRKRVASRHASRPQPPFSNRRTHAALSGRPIQLPVQRRAKSPQSLLPGPDQHRRSDSGHLRACDSPKPDQRTNSGNHSR